MSKKLYLYYSKQQRCFTNFGAKTVETPRRGVSTMVLLIILLFRELSPGL